MCCSCVDIAAIIQTQQVCCGIVSQIIIVQLLEGKHIESRPTRRKNGDTIWSGYLSDITGRKRSEAELRESEERFRLAIATSPDGISITRERDGLFVEINDAFTRMSGYTKNDTCLSNINSNFLKLEEDLHADIVRS